MFLYIFGGSLDEGLELMFLDSYRHEKFCEHILCICYIRLSKVKKWFSA